jgi:two-component sensor histidine kinase
MALVHEQLYRAGDLSVIDFAQYTQQLLQQIADTQGDVSARVALHREIARVDLGIETAVPLGLIINELVTNAYKHAFAHGRRGTIELLLRPLEGGRFELSVSDDGPGLPAGFDVTRAESLGLRLVHSLVEQVGGELSVTAAADPGCRFAIRFTPDLRERGRLPESVGDPNNGLTTSTSTAS